MEERIEIIESFNSYLGKRKKSIKHRLIYVEFLKYFSVFIISLVTFIVIKSILPLGILQDKLEWKDSALAVAISISYLLNSSSLFFESKFLRHLKKLKSNKIKSSDNDSLNIELQNAIIELNNNTKTKSFIIAWVSVLVIGSLIQLFSRGDFKYWSYFKIPFLLFIIFLFINFIKKYSIIRKNINDYEGG